MNGIVLDNSVTMRWCFDSGNHNYADDILHQLVTGTSQALVPILWRYEVNAVLARAEIKGLLTPERAAEFLEDLAALDIRVDADSRARIFMDIYQLAVRYRLTAYDAAYLELALRMSMPLATLDEELLAACQNAGVLTL